MAENTFTINTENHIAHIGADTFEFNPEVYTADLLDAYATLQIAQAKSKDVDQEDPEAIRENVNRIREITEVVKGFIGDMMTDDSKALFMTKRFPDRTLIELQNWILGVYGLRPTTSSPDSSKSELATSEAGSDSTEPSPSEA